MKAKHIKKKKDHNYANNNIIAKDNKILKNKQNINY